MKHRCVNGKARGARVGMISASLMVIMIMVMSQTALATTNHIVSRTGSTLINDAGCDADVPYGPPETLDVENGESVTIYYNYTYTDSRISGYEDARHQFVLIVNGWAKEESHITDGLGGGVGTILKTVYNVQEYGQIWVGFYANISCPAEQCYDSDQKGDYIDLE